LAYYGFDTMPLRPSLHVCGRGLQRPWLALSLRPLTALGQEQESGSTCGQARSGRRLVAM